MNIMSPTENCWEIYMLGHWNARTAAFHRRYCHKLFQTSSWRVHNWELLPFPREIYLVILHSFWESKHTPTISIWICHTSLYPTFRACVCHVCASSGRGVRRPPDPYLLLHPLQDKVQLPNATRIDTGQNHESNSKITGNKNEEMKWEIEIMSSAAFSEIEELQYEYRLRVSGPISVSSPNLRPMFEGVHW